MKIYDATNLACPIDATALRKDGLKLVCAKGHSFDRAREGYTNLLVSQHKSSNAPGDDKAMIAARRETLESGFYGPVADHLCALVSSLPEAPQERLRVADAGCGEGYYTERLRQSLTTGERAGAVELTGFDISKPAIQAAAKRSDDVTWLVANNRHMPFLPNSVDLILCLFGFPVYESFRSAQAAGGRVILADPGADHLIELRSVIYDTVRTSAPPGLKDAEAAGYRLARQSAVKYRAKLDSFSRIENLLKMTPHYFRMPASGREKLLALDSIDVTVDVVFRTLEAPLI